QLIQAHLLAEPLRPEEIGAALVERDDVAVVDLGEDPLLLPPDARPVGPLRRLVAVVEQLHPAARIAAREHLHLVLHFEERAARLAAVDDGGDRIARAAALLDALEPALVERGARLHLFPRFVGGEDKTTPAPPPIRATLLHRPRVRPLGVRVRSRSGAPSSPPRRPATPPIRRRSSAAPPPRPPLRWRCSGISGSPGSQPIRSDVCAFFGFACCCRPGILQRPRSHQPRCCSPSVRPLRLPRIWVTCWPRTRPGCIRSTSPSGRRTSSTRRPRPSA